MPTTPTYGLRYHDLNEPPDGAALGKNLAEDVEAELIRIDNDLASLLPVTGWASYTPNWSGAGSATFSTRTGRWRRIGPKTVVFCIYVVVATSGSGSNPVSTSLPTPCSRAIRWTFSGHAESPGGVLQAVTFTGSTGTIVDRILYTRPGGSPEIANITGADCVAGRLFTISGIYEEA